MNLNAPLRLAFLLIALHALAACAPRSPDTEGQSPRDSAIVLPSPRDSAIVVPPAGDSQLVVRILDVGQGDATLIENGGTVVLIDGGPSKAVLGRHLDRLNLNGDTIDAVLITHQHADHYEGIAALFETKRHITVRYLYENRDTIPAARLMDLRDSILARQKRHELVYRDTDDPCNDGTPICTLFMRGGAQLHILRPDPHASYSDGNNRSTPAKLIGPDSASFTMWFAGDAERDAIAWFDSVGYDSNPGMKANVLKGNHHGSCNGITRRYLELVSPDLATFSLGASNGYGHMHTQAIDLLKSLHIPWYRTDQNGEIVITTPGTAKGGYMVQYERGSAGASGPSDRRSTQTECAAG